MNKEQRQALLDLRKGIEYQRSFRTIDEVVVDGSLLLSLLDALDAAEAAQSARDGWQLVPKEPTLEMHAAVYGPLLCGEAMRNQFKQHWKLALAAAPTPADAEPGQQPELKEPVAWLKTWDSVGGAQKGLRRVDLTPECETWLANMFPKVEPLYRSTTPSVADTMPNIRFAGAMPPEPEEMKEAANKLANWLATALDDENVCAEYKQAINDWFDAAMPFPVQEARAQLAQQPAGIDFTTDDADLNLLLGLACDFATDKANADTAMAWMDVLSRVLSRLQPPAGQEPDDATLNALIAQAQAATWGVTNQYRYVLARLAPPQQSEQARDGERWQQLLSNLVEGLDRTSWSTWQTTAHFWGPFEAAQEAIAAVKE